jgi:predicted PurR-regulated permease PerM
VKKALRNFVLACVAGFIIGMFAAAYERKGPLPTVSAAILVLLIALVILLWRVLTLLHGIAGKLGFNPARTQRIDKLLKKLKEPIWSTSKLTEAQRKELDEELEEITEADWYQEPAHVGQLIRVIEHLQNISALLAAREKPPATS